MAESSARGYRIFLPILALIIFLYPLTGHAQVFGVLGVGMRPCPTRCGIVITEIIPGSSASQAGLQVGDIIQQLNWVYVYDDVSGVDNFIKGSPGKIVYITISRLGYMLGGYVMLGTANTSDSYPETLTNSTANANAYPQVNPPASNITINVFGNIEGQHNETHQTGTGNVSSQSNMERQIGIPVVPETNYSAPSFDCAIAATASERMICSSRELSEADAKLARAYKAAKNVIFDKDALKGEQNAWRRNERDVCYDIKCMLSAYQNRIKQLEQLSGR